MPSLKEFLRSRPSVRKAILLIAAGAIGAVGFADKMERNIPGQFKERENETIMRIMDNPKYYKKQHLVGLTFDKSGTSFKLLLGRGVQPWDFETMNKRADSIVEVLSSHGINVKRMPLKSIPKKPRFESYYEYKLVK
ncbi:MAG: hypothetical protein AABY04_02415 [Candidatus Micrarchaeota archaeon]